MSFVLDSSVALSWCFEDERTNAALAVLDRLAEFGASAPALWPLEVLNALSMAERRGRLDAERRERLAGFLHKLPVTIDKDTANQAWSVTQQLATRYRLTLYDAAYLELAQRLALPLATLDQDLRMAADSAGVALLGV
ncbi:MAG: type II toxin-antitoxin system VapC family toxin [Rhodocyclaceae bacterium]|nr:type II toxin-antitoxin system VapC family toxin [Rhodocyclaceae bacterium]MBX3667836.1 type II toxin-antitoxin system VapC family toxin [Rhodocyclaceae bacterium]